MKMEETDEKKDKKKPKMSESDSMRSLDEPPKDYESMLQKYEAEVRNHIKVSQLTVTFFRLNSN